MKNFILRSVLPTLLTISLFVFAIFFFTLPTLEKSFMDQKKEMIRELTNSAWNILARFEYDEKNGSMTRQQAQQQAIESIQSLHYGQGMKDYFWINDMHPRMIIHPYRTDLNGKDLSDITDPSGMKLFVKFVDVVKESGAGYVEYQWQWKDDSTRISPKLSYVKGFEPWGWVIGTGVYLNDVYQEIDSIRNHLIFFSTLILIFVSGLLTFLVSGSYQTEKLRAKAEINLRTSEEKYRMLVESAGEYMIMSLGGQNLFANNSMLKLLGYSAEEFSEKTISQIIELTPAEIKTGYPYSVALMKGEQIPLQYEGYLLTKDGSRCRVMISLSSIPQKQTVGFLIIASEITAQQERAIQQDVLLEELQRSFLYYHQKVADLSSFPAVLCSENDSLSTAGKHFQDNGVNAILVSSDGDNVKGVLSLQTYVKMLSSADFNPRTTLQHADLEKPVYVDDNSLLFDAYLQFENNDFNHLFVKNDQGRPVSLINGRSFVCLQHYSPTNLLRRLQTAQSEEDLEKAAGVLPELAKVFIHNKIETTHVNRIITDVADIILEKAIELSVRRLGKPPVEFCFLVMGSEGRGEQTLCTDQDNAILFADVSPQDETEVRSYFEALGEAVCNLLNRCGYAFCKGKIMAKNPAWCLTLTKWKALFSSWISTLEPQDLLQANIFFDFRSVNEQENKSEKSVYLIDELQKHLDAELDMNPRFYFFLARNMLQSEPPLGLFGNFTLETLDNREDVFDIKKVMNMLVDLTRVYALKHGVRARNTQNRLQALKDMGVFSSQSHDEVIHAFSCLMRIRLENQARLLDQGEKPDNFIRPDQLTSIDQKILKEIFSQIKHLQVKLSYEFTGMMGGN